MAFVARPGAITPGVFDRANFLCPALFDIFVEYISVVFEVFKFNLHAICEF